MKASLLLVDDDADLAKITLASLKKGGCKTSWAKTADEALSSLKKEAFDAIILDIELPGLSGLKLLEILKNDPKTATIPVILLTVLSSSADKVRGLKSGADDYLTKPFSSPELLARVEAVLRRTNNSGRLDNTLGSGSISVDLDRQEASVGGKPVALTRAEFELLTLFIRRPGFVLTYETLADALAHGAKAATSETLYAHVKNLRHKLGAQGERIETVHGIGYKFLAQ